jgi:predicted porin
MKKSFVALAALATLTSAGIASAQSSVTLFGVVDAAVSSYSNKAETPLGNSLTTSQTALTNSGYNSSRLGFRGTEDLGGGLAASFWLEAGLNNDDGSGASSALLQSYDPVTQQFVYKKQSTGGLSFNRRSTVSLSGAFGEVRLGRDYTPTYWNDTVFDPFGANGVGTNLIASAGQSMKNENYTRASNSVGYFLPPNLGGVYGQFMYSFNEKEKFDPAVLTPDVPNSQRTGRYIGGRVGYANGPVDVAVSYGQSTVGDDFFLGLTANSVNWSLGTSYDFGPVKLFGEYSDNRLEIDTESFGLLVGPGTKGWLLGATVPVGPGLIRASYSAVRYRGLELAEEPKADKFAIGYVHNLSKRTAVYTTVARVNNKNGTGFTVGGPAYNTVFEGVSNVPKSSTGYDIGIRHAF